MHPAKMFRALVSAVVLTLAAIPFQGCLAEQQLSLQETFKAVISTSGPPLEAPTLLADSPAGPAMERLAADLVASLSDLLLERERVAMVAGAVTPSEAAAWNLVWESLTGVRLEGAPSRTSSDAPQGAGTAAGTATAAAAAAASRETARRALSSGEPCDLRATSKEEAGAREPPFEGRRLRGEGSSLGAGGAEAVAAGSRGLLEGAEGAALGVEGQGPASAAALGCEEALGNFAEEDFLKIESTWLNVVMTAVCVVCAGLAAGLTMGLLSIEPLEMAIKQRSGTPEEQLQASRLLPLVSRHHFLLVTLLLFNSLANEALPIFLGNLVPSWLAVILSVSLVLFFGEIFPSAVFTGKNQLAIAAGMAWLVYTLMFVLGAVAWPIAWMLDRILGIEGFKRYNRAEIAALVEVQQELGVSEDVTNIPLHMDEVSIVNGVLLTAERSVSEAMITMDKVFCLGNHEKLSADTMADIMAAGYSRILVYEGEDTRNIRGYLQVKKLIVLNPDDERTISSLMLRIPVVVSPNKSLLELLNIFQTGKSHLALVSASPAITLESLKRGVSLEGAARPVGIITLEDIIEEIIQEEIMDESDRLTQFIENRAKDTLARFAKMRRERLGNGLINPRLTSVFPGTPRRSEESTLLKHIDANSVGHPSGARGGNVTPPSPSYQSMAGGRSIGFAGGAGAVNSTMFGSSPPAAPGLEERTALLAGSTRSGSQRRLSGAKNSKRGSAIVGQAMIAAAGRAREHSSGNNAAAAAATASADGSPPFTPFPQASSGSNAGDAANGDS